jgi:hypothetical protein
LVHIRTRESGAVTGYSAVPDRDIDGWVLS